MEISAWYFMTSSTIYVFSAHNEEIVLIDFQQDIVECQLLVWSNVHKIKTLCAIGIIDIIQLLNANIW